VRVRERPGKKPLAVSLGVHAAVLVGAWMIQLGPPEMPEFVTYEITLVSPPSAQQAAEPEPQPAQELVVETPKPVVEAEPPPVVEERRREEEKPRPTPTSLPKPEETPPGDPSPSETASGQDLNVHMEGLRRDFPEYYANIIAQIRRCLRFNGVGRWETTVLFYINRDGTVDGDELRFVERSGNVDFDYAAMGAVECAGRGRFGALPEDLGLDRIPILFTFTPRGR
jgi:outer membrane biosynthesis protein TonB